METLDQAPREALIEVTIAEVTLDDSKALGVEWALNLGLGAYRGGTDPAVDEAIRLAPRIEAMLAQGKGEGGTVETAFAALAEALDGG